MKISLKKWLCVLMALTLLTLGITAFAETEANLEQESAEQIETVEEAPEEPTVEEPTEEDLLDEEPNTDESEYEDTSYLDALEAYNKARLENSLNELKAELDQMVTNAQLTRAQADLIFSRAQEQMEASSEYSSEYIGKRSSFSTDWGYSKGTNKNASKNRWNKSNKSYSGGRW